MSDTQIRLKHDRSGTIETEGKKKFRSKLKFYRSSRDDEYKRKFYKSSREDEYFQERERERKVMMNLCRNSQQIQKRAREPYLEPNAKKTSRLRRSAKNAIGKHRHNLPEAKRKEQRKRNRTT